MTLARNTVELAIADGATPLPTEFRLFVAGWNPTEKGSFLFDADAAAAVMAAAKRWGVDLAIDLEHQMLEPGIAPDPTAKDARGWFNLELRADGSLWAVNVRWTADGAARLTQRRQRYVSPAFEIDPQTKRVTQIVNVAITAMPATHNTPALIAASAQGGRMDPTKVGEALDALVAGDAEKCMQLLKDIIAAAAGAESAEEPAAEEAPAAEAPAEMSAPPAEEDPEAKAAAVAASKVVSLAGAKSLVDALSIVETWRESHVALETERQKLAADRAVLEAAERRRLAVELISLGAEFPSTVWADDKGTTLKARWLDMSIATLRTHVAEQRAARGGKRAPAPPRGEATEAEIVITTALGPVTLSASEQAECKRAGADLTVYAANKAKRLRRGGK